MKNKNVEKSITLSFFFLYAITISYNIYKLPLTIKHFFKIARFPPQIFRDLGKKKLRKRMSNVQPHLLKTFTVIYVGQLYYELSLLKKNK